MGFQLQGKQRPIQKVSGTHRCRVFGKTVWMERVPQSYLRDIKILTDATKGTIRVQPILSSINASQKNPLLLLKMVISCSRKRSGLLRLLKFRSRTPSFGHLPIHSFIKYMSHLLDANDQVLDQVSSYAGIRTVGKAKDKDGHWRFTLNGEFIFHWGPLDQGWWPDGLLTLPLMKRCCMTSSSCRMPVST